jgi:Protein of unknown function (DUF3572)
MKRRAQVSRNTAEMLAIQALAFIAEDPERGARFLGMSGIAAEEIRAAARESAFLAGVLEHMLGDENLLIAFAASAGIDPGEIAQARSVLGGPEESGVP